MDSRVDNPFTELPAWLGGVGGAGLLAWLGRVVWRLDRHGKRIDGAEETIDKFYQGVLGEATQALESHARDRAEWRQERLALIAQNSACEAKNDAQDRQISALIEKIDSMGVKP